MHKVLALLIKRTITSLVVVSFLLQPIAVLAEEASGETSSEQVVSTEVARADGEGSAPEATNNEIKSADENADENNEDFSDDGKDPNQYLNLAKKIGNYSNSKTAKDMINLFTGSANYSYGIDVPKGRANQTPVVQLNYSSQRKNSQENIYGYGWDLGMNYISRDTTYGYLNLFSENNFIVSGQIDNGRLVKSPTSTSLYFLKNASDYKKYNFENNNWSINDANGNTYYFGSTNDSRQASSTQANLVFKWMLDKVKDTNGNEINYSYFKDEGQIYLKSIKYTVSEGNSGDFEIRFYPFYSNPTTPNRNDIKVGYTNGFRVENRFKLDEIRVSQDADEIIKYVLNYTNENTSKHLLLLSIKESRLQKSSNTWNDLPLTIFEYNQVDYQSPWEAISKTTDFPAISALSSMEQKIVNQEGDINGDGLIDLMATQVGVPIASATSSWAYISEPNGSWRYTYNYLKIPEIFQYDPQNYDDSIKGGAILLDVNNDGLSDIFRSSFHFSNNYHKEVKRIYTFNNDNFSLIGTTSIPFVFQRGAPETFRLADVNGDKLVDFILSYDYVYNSYGHIIHSLRGTTYLNDGNNGWVESNSYAMPEPFAELSSDYISRPNLGTQLIDINGDGLVDIVRSIYDPYNYILSKQVVYLNNGYGFELSPNNVLPIYLYKNHYFGNGENFDDGVRFADVNNDGLPDLVQSIKQTNQKRIFINTGNGWQEIQNPNIPFYITDYNIYGAGQTNFTGDIGTRLQDVDGDGVNDFYYNGIYKTGKNLSAYTLSKIKESNGSEINFSYKSSSEYKNINGDRKNIMQVPQIVLDRIVINDGLGNNTETNILYSGGTYYQNPNNKSEKQFAGFGVVEVSEQNKMTRTYFHQGGGFDGSQLGEYQDDESKIGQVYRQETYDTTNGAAQKKPVNSQINKWKSQTIGSQKFLSLDSTANIDDEGKLLLAQPLIDDYVNGRLNTSFASKTNQKFNPNLNRVFLGETNLSAKYVPDISTDNADYFYLGNDTNGFEYVGIFGTDSLINSTTTATTTIAGSICAYGTLSSNWAGMVNQSSGVVSDELRVENSSYNAGSKTLCRAFLPFDTRSIPSDTTTIQEARLDFNINYTEFENSVGSVSGGNLSNPPGLSPIDYSSITYPTYSFNLSTTSTVQHVTIDFIPSNVRPGNYTPAIVRGPLDYYNAYMQYYYRSMFKIAGNDNLNPNIGPKLYVRFTTQNPLTKAIDLEVNHKINPINEVLPITFGAKYNNDNVNAKATHYKIVLARESDGYTNPVWDSGKIQLSNQYTAGSRVENLPYTGPNLLLDGTKYIWKIKFWDEHNNELLYSTEFASFSLRIESIGKGANYQYDAQTNRLVQENQLGKGNYNVMSGELINEIPGDEQTTNYEYASSTTALPILNAVKQKTLSATTENITYKQQSYYDQLPYGQVSKNNKTKDDFIVQQINQQFVYDNYGLPIKQIDPLGKETTYEYDSKRLYPTKVINAKGQTINMVYDNFSGQPTLITDPNGLQEQRSYDAFGRLISVKKSALDGSGTMTELERYSYNDFSMPRSVKKETKTGENTWAVSVEYYNGLGQLIQTRNKYNGNDFAVVSQQYDSLGRVVKTTLPYSAGGEAFVAENWNTPVVVKEYDALNRVTKEITPAGTNRFSYDGYITTITDANEVQKKIERDAYDRLVAVEEYIDGQFVKTKYSYNVLGKLTKIVDSQNNEREFVYDDLGRLLSQTEMHKPGVSGNSWQYEYDQNSRVKKQTDPNGNVTTYDYDQLDRVTKETTTDGQINYVYDQGINAVGRLTKVESSYGVGYKKEIKHNLWGGVTQENVTINQRPFSTIYEYDFLGRNNKTIQPNGSAIDYKFDELSRFDGFYFTEKNGTPKLIVRGVAYHVSGRPDSIEYNGNILTDFSYDIQTQRLIKKTTEIRGIFVQDYNYQYDSLGNIIELADNSISKTAKTMTYEYDTLSRLVRATAVNTASNSDFEETYSYDWLGNILNKSDVGDYLYNNNNPHQASVIGSNNYTYDANGNVIDDGNNSYVYSANNRLAKATSANSGLVSSYTYDPSGTRVYKKVLNTVDKIAIATHSGYDSSHGSIDGDHGDYTQSSVVETYYPNSAYEFVNDNNSESVSVHVYGLGQRLAQIDGTNVKLILTDHLGSTQHVVSDSGEILTTYDYYPFGGLRIGDGDNGSKKQFSGKIKDETNLNYFEARYLDTSVGRFKSQDPIYLSAGNEFEIKEKTGKLYNQFLSDSQNFNSYNYARNNPLKYVDTTGEYWESVLDVVSLGLSLYDFNKKNSFVNGMFVGLDAAGLALPIPAVFGYIKNGARAVKIANYFNKLSNNAADAAMLGKLFIQHTGFKFTELAWSIGEAGNDVASLVGHYFKHGGKVGAKNVKEYYDMANDLIKSVDNKKVFEIKNLYSPGSVDYFDLSTKNLVGVGKDGSISSFQNVYDPDKLNKIMNEINLIK